MRRFIGDVHGKYGPYKNIIKNSPYPTFQVGDMGVGFFKWPSGSAAVNPPYDLMVEHGARFIRGNHDNPKVCSQHTQCVPDGTIEGNVMYIGGGLSIDKPYRVESYSYWSNEELNDMEFKVLVHKYQETKPRFMVTHEAPEDVALEVVRKNGDRRIQKLDFPSRTRVYFQEMWQAHSPEIWVFGHWHMPFDHVLNGTRFICLPELEVIDLEI